MGTTRTERAIDDFDPLADDDFGCDDIRLVWLAAELHAADDASEFDALQPER